jgi:hypothetical protein
VRRDRRLERREGRVPLVDQLHVRLRRDELGSWH